MMKERLQSPDGHDVGTHLDVARSDRQPISGCT
jgi:hypothetical protein